MQLIRQIVARRELLWILVVRNLKIRYKQSVLGFFWSLLAPLLLIVIYAIFAAILRFNTGRPHYLQFLVIGIVIWQFLAMCLNDSLGAVVGNANLVKKTAFPRLILPLAMVCANFINFLLSWCVLLLYLVLVGMPFEALWLLPLAMVLQIALCLGMGLLIATSNVFFRDTEHILGVGTLAWFFLSPVFYPAAMQLEQLERLAAGWSLPIWMPNLAFLNPMTLILWLYRRALMGSALDDVATLTAGQAAVSVLVTIGVLALGLMAFVRCDPRFGDEL